MGQGLSPFRLSSFRLSSFRLSFTSQNFMRSSSFYFGIILFYCWLSCLLNSHLFKVIFRCGLFKVIFHKDIKSSSINEMNLIIKWVCQCVCGGHICTEQGGVAVNNSNNQIHYVVFQSQMLLYSVYMAYLTDKLIGSKPNKEKKH